MELITLQQQIESKNKQLEIGRKLLKESAHEWASAESEYHRILAITMAKLKAGEAFELDGVTVQDSSTTNLYKNAQGICWREELRKIEAEAIHRSRLKGMDALMAEQSGLQSINKYLGES